MLVMRHTFNRGMHGCIIWTEFIDLADLIIAPRHISRSGSGLMIMLEGVLLTRRYIHRSLNLQLGFLQPSIEFIVFKSPTPIMIGETVYFTKDFAGDEKNASDESLVFVSRMQPRGGNMANAIGWKCVWQLIIEGDEINVMKCDIVAIVNRRVGLREQEPCIQKTASVETVFVHLVLKIKMKFFNI